MPLSLTISLIRLLKVKPYLIKDSKTGFSRKKNLQECVSEVPEESLEHREPAGIEPVPPFVLLQGQEPDQLVDVLVPDEEVVDLPLDGVQLFRLPSKVGLAVFRVDLKSISL